MAPRPLRVGVVGLAAVVLSASSAPAAPVARAPRPRADEIPSAPSYVQKVELALVALKVHAREGSPSSVRLGTRRFGTGVLFDARGYAVTASYVVLDAVALEAQTRDGRVVPARVAGMDLESGLAVVQLAGAGSWPAATLGSSHDVRTGAVTGSVAVDEDNDLVHAQTSVQAIRRFSAFWEYMLERAFIVAPAISSWAGAAVVDETGRVIGIVSLRIGEAPYVNVAIPIDRFVPVKDELITRGRVVSRRPRAWLGLNTHASQEGVFVDGFSEVGPARRAGFQPGDQIIGVDGVDVRSQEEFYEQLWRREPGETVEVAVRRGGAVRVIRLRSADRYRIYAPTR